MELTPKQQASEAVRQAETILVTTGQHPSVDQAAAVIALALILRKFGKKVTAIVSDSLPPQVNFLPTSTLDRDLTGLRDFIIRVDLAKAEVDKLKYTISEGKLNIHLTPFKGGFAGNDVSFDYGNFHYDLVIVLGVPTRARLDRVFSANPSLFDTVPVINLDFHRSNENYGAVNLIEPTASSLSEILVALAESLQTGIIDEPIATALLTGIMSSTDRFTATHTTPKSLTVAAQLMAGGANQQLVVKNLFRSGSDNRAKDRPGGQPKTQPAIKSSSSDRSAAGSPKSQPPVFPSLINPLESAKPEPEVSERLNQPVSPDSPLSRPEE